MTDTRAAPQNKDLGFWRRLAYALEPMAEAYEERLERRVRRLEVEVARLSMIPNEQEKHVGTANRATAPAPLKSP
ncbi:MAG: hypothetical protein ACREXY_26630 [Gammaproteobacteria bacterium]